MIDHAAVVTWPATLGWIALFVGLIACVGTIFSYLYALLLPTKRTPLLSGRLFYALTGISVLTTFGCLAYLVYNYHFEYKYVWEHTGKDMIPWYRFAATWAGQEGSFLLWGAWTSIIGFLVFAKAGKYEARVMPFFVSVLGFLCGILLRQSPFEMIPVPSAADLAANPSWHYPPLIGQGLNPSLQNYWMTIHPPTIFFGFSSLLVPFCYAVAALIWKDYKDWTFRVMPYALLSCATLGIGLFMGGYWAYETQGWHGFWAWDPVENASFFPWLAVTALIHGLVVQKSRGGMARTNTFLGVFTFSLFLLGTFMTRSGVLGDNLSVHSFANISKSGLIFMIVMLAVYGLGGLILWAVRLPSIPGRKTTGDTLVSRDFAFFLAVLLMILACIFVALGTTAPLFQQWFHRPQAAPQAVFYNRGMYPAALLAAFLMGTVPWLAWRKTNPDDFLKRLVIPWMIMLAFGFFILLWVLNAERSYIPTEPVPAELQDPNLAETAKAWIHPSVQRMAVVSLASLGFLAVLSNAMMAFRVFRSKPMAAGGWLAHVGVGVLIIGVIISNTYEKTKRFLVIQGASPEQVATHQEAFGYKFEYEKQTGTPLPTRPLNPDYDKNNGVQLRVTPPDGEPASLTDGSRTFLSEPRSFVHNLDTAPEDKFEHIRWPDIRKYVGHDLYVGLANDPIYIFPSDHADSTGGSEGITLMPKEKRELGPYTIGYFDSVTEPRKYFGVILAILTPDKKVIQARPGIKMGKDEETGQMKMTPVDFEIPELKDKDGAAGVIYLDRLDASTKAATLRISLPEFRGQWAVPMEVTYKPWVNLVWIGVLIAVGGILLAMVNRALDARKVSDGLLNKAGEGDWEPSAETPLVALSVAETPEATAIPVPETKRRKLRPSPAK